jgi:hypothetical protein
MHEKHHRKSTRVRFPESIRRSSHMSMIVDLEWLYGFDSTTASIHRRTIVDCDEPPSQSTRLSIFDSFIFNNGFAGVEKKNKRSRKKKQHNVYDDNKFTVSSASDNCGFSDIYEPWVQTMSIILSLVQRVCRNCNASASGRYLVQNARTIGTDSRFIRHVYA